MSISLTNRTKAFVELGKALNELLKQAYTAEASGTQNPLIEAIEKAENQNPWFVRSNVLRAIEGIASMLDEKVINNWLAKYKIPEYNTHPPKCVAVIMAGNIPVVGFHDFMCVLLSGNTFLGKFSSQDSVLPKFVADLLIEIEPGFKNSILFTDGMLSQFDAVIATGSNNSARYFDYYFGKYPHIIRRNRNGVALLTGQETLEDLALLADDVFLHFGLGCRNVSKLLVPENYDFNPLFQSFEKWNYIGNFHKYFNNYEYHKAIMLVNMIPHLDNGFLLLRENNILASPTAVLYYQYYKSLSDAEKYISDNKDAIQCLVANPQVGTISGINITGFGKSQSPGPDEYADRQDTLEFLLNI